MLNMHKRTLFWTTALGALLCGGTALAQVAAPADTAVGDDDAIAAAQAGDRAQVLAGEAPTAADGPGEPIVVTGTRIVRPNLKAASPITTITSSEIRQQGAVNVEEVLNRFPQIAPDSSQNYQNSNGKQRVKLRSLDFNRTLTLIDGQRMAGTESVDVNLIPVSLIERVDLLTGGASSVYGSDAVAGVVNFILKKNFEGLQLSGNYSFYNHDNRDNGSTPVAQANGIATPRGNTSGGGRVDINATFGHNYLDDRLNITGFVGYRQGDSILFKDRDYSGCQLQRVGTGLGCILTAASPNGTITPLSGASANQNFSNVSSGDRTFAAASTIPGYNNSGDREALRGFERVNIGAFANLELSSAVQLYSNVLFLQDKSKNSFYGPYIQSYTSYGTTPYRTNCDNPLMSGQQAQTICGAAAGTSATAPLNVQYGFPDLEGNRSEDTFDNKSARVVAGVRGEIAQGWKYDIGGVYAYNRDLWITDGRPLYSKINRALDVVNVNGVATCRSVVNGTDPACVPLDVFRANSGSAALQNYLFNERRAISDTVGKMYDVTANLTVDLSRYGIKSPFAEQGLALSAGGEYRKLTQDIFRNDRYTDVYGTTSSSVEQDVREANVEAQLPLVENRPFLKLLQVNGGYRWSKYNTNSNTFATWKIEGIYSPTPDLTLRIGKNRAQRAPTVNEGDQALAFSTYNVNDFCAGTPGPNGTTIAPRGSIEACRASGLADNLYGSTTLSCPDGLCRQRIGGRELNPEDAMTLTYGVVLTPRFIPGLSLSVDRYEIQVNDIIGFNYANFAIDGCVATAADYYCSLIVRNPDGTLFGASTTSGYVQAGTSNLYRLDSRGVDFQGQYAFPAPWAGGRLDVLFNGSLTTYSGGQDSPTTQPKNCTGYFGPRCGQPVPEWTHVMRAGYASEDGVFGASVAWRFIGATNTTLNSTDPGIGSTASDRVTTYTRIPAYHYFDLALNFNIQKKMTLTMSANNIFDRMPPVIPNTYAIAFSRSNTFPARYDALGRQLSVAVTTRF